MDHSIISIWILDPESRIISRISELDLPSRSIAQFITSSLTNLHHNSSTPTIMPSTWKMYIIPGFVMVVEYRLLMVASCWPETLFLVAEAMTINWCCKCSFLDRRSVVNIKSWMHLEICREIYNISYILIILILESSQLNGLTWINICFNHTIQDWVNRIWDSYIQSGAQYSPYNIWQNSSDADYCIFRSNKAQANSGTSWMPRLPTRFVSGGHLGWHSDWLLVTWTYLLLIGFKYARIHTGYDQKQLCLNMTTLPCWLG